MEISVTPTTLSNGTVLTGTMAKPTTATGNAYTGATGNLNVKAGDSICLGWAGVVYSVR